MHFHYSFFVILPETREPSANLSVILSGNLSGNLWFHLSGNKSLVSGPERFAGNGPGKILDAIWKILDTIRLLIKKIPCVAKYFGKDYFSPRCTYILITFSTCLSNNSPWIAWGWICFVRRLARGGERCSK